MDISSIIHGEAVDLTPKHGLSTNSHLFTGRSATQTNRPAQRFQESEICALRPLLKLPIPILLKPASHLRSRVARACALCRENKSKCTGEKPFCQRCVLLQRSCQYPESKSNEMKRSKHRLPWLGSVRIDIETRTLELSTAEILDYRATLHKLQSRASAEDSRLISAILLKVCTRMTTGRTPEFERTDQ